MDMARCTAYAHRQDFQRHTRFRDRLEEPMMPNGERVSKLKEKKIMRVKPYRKFAVFGAFILGCAALTSTAAAQKSELDGTEKSIVVVGYSTSYVWPSMLQDMLDEHAGGERTYHVLNAVIGGAPVAHWSADYGTDEYKRTFGAMISDFFGPDAKLRKDEPDPAKGGSIAIAQQSLQLTRDDRGPVKTEYDMVGAEMGADEMQTMSLRLKGLGLDRIYIAMHIYKKPVEPEVGNERIALNRLLSRGIDGIKAGPDLWSATKECFPECFIEDELHPNDLGYKIMAEHWYKTLAGENAKEAVVKSLYSKNYGEWREIMEEYLAWRRGE